MSDQLHISDNAAERIKALIAEETGKTGLRFRVMIEGGGCSGFQYQMDLDDHKGPQDVIFSHNGVEVIVDDLSLSMLSGATLDYKETLASASFEILNPNAAASCGCGNSFSV